jgi:hypothetical protein
MLYPRAMKPYSANGNPNAKAVQLPPIPKHVHVPRPDEGETLNEFGTLLLCMVGFYVLPDLLGFIGNPGVNLSLFRFLLSCFLGYMVLRGNSTARWWMVTFSGITGIFSLIAGIGLVFINPMFAGMMVFTLTPLVIAVSLVVPPLSKHFER